MGQIQYNADAHNNITGVIVPIDLWREIQAEKETAYLLKSESMKKRLLGAKKRISTMQLLNRSPQRVLRELCK